MKGRVDPYSFICLFIRGPKKRPEKGEAKPIQAKTTTKKRGRKPRARAFPAMSRYATSLEFKTSLTTPQSDEEDECNYDDDYDDDYDGHIDEAITECSQPARNNIVTRSASATSTATKKVCRSFSSDSVVSNSDKSESSDTRSSDDNVSSDESGYPHFSPPKAPASVCDSDQGDSNISKAPPLMFQKNAALDLGYIKNLLQNMAAGGVSLKETAETVSYYDHPFILRSFGEYNSLEYDQQPPKQSTEHDRFAESTFITYLANSL
eukprot:GEZU01026517.1.p1 GENE.GEZU01026517.1~~GEZU01026517.1.p1  ORF type:complete len:264 (-),score=33.94 GEZU01026517.1:692-1483(-)